MENYLIATYPNELNKEPINLSTAPTGDVPYIVTYDSDLWMWKLSNSLSRLRRNLETSGL
ncbi:hypothetical protein [Spirosoma validum]|uniref:Uncharacterized protein n=1 Tax=Spirosoma validum TaxID=2771355 RepID=A0A927B231_9BACT|nr:hypothetical protein [Spirosoma validum]MBD2753903.1 hypothetical protein [Spirosoma validum]